jgi:hypothetical protein
MSIAAEAHNWINVGSNDEATFYIDSTNHSNGDTGVIWTLINYKKPTHASGTPFFLLFTSQKNLMVFDCPTRKINRQEIVRYLQQMGDGNSVWQVQNNNVLPITQGTIVDRAYKAACE